MSLFKEDREEVLSEETEREDHKCKCGCICKVLSKLLPGTPVDVKFTGTDADDNIRLVFSCVDLENCCGIFFDRLPDGSPFNEAIWIPCEKIAFLREVKPS
ncbi:hypothetical protein ACSVDE_04300 [Pseudalkalibacillus sp. Hm43]|uniref:hypothetical protein n=1 Tax=Pseudalkalibacillus sp. Hm43 TaxID=3450742 RepID=UPI003F422B48